MHATLTGMADRLQRSRADSAQLLQAANELSERESRLCARRDVIVELESALAVPLTQRNILCSAVVSDEFFDALELAHSVCRYKCPPLHNSSTLPSILQPVSPPPSPNPRNLHFFTLCSRRRCTEFLSSTHRSAVSEALQESRNLVERSLSTVYSWLEQQSSRCATLRHSRYHHWHFHHLTTSPQSLW